MKPPEEQKTPGTKQDEKPKSKEDGSKPHEEKTPGTKQDEKPKSKEDGSKPPEEEETLRTKQQDEKPKSKILVFAVLRIWVPCCFQQTCSTVHILILLVGHLSHSKYFLLILY